MGNNLTKLSKRSFDGFKRKPTKSVALLAITFCLIFVGTANSIELGIGGDAGFSRQIREGNWDYINPIIAHMELSEVKSTRVGFPCTLYLNSPLVGEYLANFQIFLDICELKEIDVILLLSYGSSTDYINIFEITECSTIDPETMPDAARAKFPPTVAAWETYVQGMMDNYGDQISGVEVWNEPDHLERMFYGRVEDYIALYILAEEIVKDDFPFMPLATGGLSCREPIYRSYLEALLDPDSGVYDRCDAFGLHCYSGRALDVLRVYEEVCAGMLITPKPVWITEFGRRLDEDLAKSYFSESGARSYPEHVLEIFSSHGVERAFWFCATCESEHGGAGGHNVFDWDEDTDTLTPNEKWYFYSAAVEKHLNYGFSNSIGFGNADGLDLFGVSPFEDYNESPNNPTVESAFQFVDNILEYPVRSRIIDSNVMAISFDLNDSWVENIQAEELVVEVDIRSYGSGAEIEFRYQSCCETTFRTKNLVTTQFDSLLCPAFLDGLALVDTAANYQIGVPYSENVNVDTLAFSPGTITTVTFQIEDWMFQNGLERRSDITFVPANANVDSFEIHRIEIYPPIDPPVNTVEYEDKSAETQLQYSGQPRNAASLNYNEDGFKDLLITRYDDTSVANRGQYYGISGAPFFVDQTTVVFPEGSEIESGANGIISGDFDNDGWVDFFATNPEGEGRLYRNMNGEYFEDWTVESGLNTLSYSSVLAGAMTCSWGDYDGDGFLDLALVSDYGGDPGVYCLEVFHNSGGIFDAVVFEPNFEVGISPLWADFDNDGDLDLFILKSAAIPPCGGPPENPYHNYYYDNQGDGSFVVDTNRIDLEMDCHTLQGKIGSVTDFDNDGDLDILCAEEGIVFVLENDGLFSGLGYFTPVAHQLGNFGYYPPADLAVLDYDLDGFQDILVGFGPNVSSGGTANLFLLANREGAASKRILVNATEDLGITGNEKFAGIASADYNLDGFSDIYLTKQGNAPFFFKAKAKDGYAQNSWIGLRLQSSAGANNTSGIGARVEVTAGPNTFTQIVDGGSGFASQHEADLIFGLGDYIGLVSVQVTWPNGHIQSVSGLETAQYHTIIDDSPVVDNNSVDLRWIFHLESGLADWVFTWTTLNNSSAALDKVKFDLSNVPGRCPPGIAEIYEQLDDVTVSIVPIGQNLYEHTLTLANIVCESRCSIPYTVESSANGSISTSESHSILIRSCVVGFK